MGPNELRAYAAQSSSNYEEAEAELRRRWVSFDGFLPETDFVSVLDPRE
jgi:hypothetical protein